MPKRSNDTRPIMSTQSSPGLDERLVREMEWHLNALSHYLPSSNWHVDSFLLFRAIFETLMLVDLIEQNPVSVGGSSKLRPEYQRDGETVVLLCAVLELVVDGAKAEL